MVVQRGAVLGENNHTVNVFPARIGSHVGATHSVPLGSGNALGAQIPWGCSDSTLQYPLRYSDPISQKKSK